MIAWCIEGVPVSLLKGKLLTDSTESTVNENFLDDVVQPYVE